MNELRDLAPLIVAAVALFGFAGYSLARSPWPLGLAMRHMMAAPNCAAARAVDLAPSYQGQPGYYLSHDRDGDGLACEPWSGR